MGWEINENDESGSVTASYRAGMETLQIRAEPAYRTAAQECARSYTPRHITVHRHGEIDWAIGYTLDERLSVASGNAAYMEKDWQFWEQLDRLEPYRAALEELAVSSPQLNVQAITTRIFSAENDQAA